MIGLVPQDAMRQDEIDIASGAALEGRGVGCKSSICNRWQYGLWEDKPREAAIPADHRFSE